MTRSGASRYSPPLWRFRGFAAGTGLIPDRSSLLSRPSVPRAGRRPSGRLAGPGCRGPTARCRRSGWCRSTATERPSCRCSVRPGAFLDAHMPGPVSSSSSRWWSATIIRPRGCSPGWRRDESPHPDHDHQTGQGPRPGRKPGVLEYSQSPGHGGRRISTGCPTSSADRPGIQLLLSTPTCS